MIRSATISECGLYRYKLTRIWDPTVFREKAGVLWIMLNPSKADAEVDDATIRKCIGFAKRWGYGGIVVGNLNAYRATSPREMWSAKFRVDIIGPKNEAHLVRMLKDDAIRRVVVAWGAEAYRDASTGLRSEDVLRLIRLHGHKPECLGLTSYGYPRHPVRLPYDTALQEVT